MDNEHCTLSEGVGGMTMARRQIVAAGEVGAYHCIARCVRRAFLCGNDALSGKNFDHRKAWIRERLELLASAFAVDIGGYAVMDNHLHVVLRIRPDITDAWSAEEVTRRWRTVYGKQPTTRAERQRWETWIEIESADPKLVAVRRSRLGSVSWLMSALAEPIARRANREDGCKGRFWEGRFRCQALLDDAAVLACSAYVDLNPVRAGLAKTPESSQFTSAADRISQRRKPARNADDARDNWLSPLTEQKPPRGKPARRATNDPWLSVSLDDYLKLLDWTGRQIRRDKKGAIPADLSPILDRLKIQQDGWLGCVQNFGRWFKHAAGAPERMQSLAQFTRRRWLQGITYAQTTFG